MGLDSKDDFVYTIIAQDKRRRCPYETRVLKDYAKWGLEGNFKDKELPCTYFTRRFKIGGQRLRGCSRFGYLVFNFNKTGTSQEDVCSTKYFPKLMFPVRYEVLY
jgi:hypothetical protein